jgi:hypothetical protein
MSDLLSDPPSGGLKPPENAPHPPPTPPATAPAPEILAPPPAAVIVTTGTRTEREIDLQRQLDERDQILKERETECAELQDANRSLREVLKPAPRKPKRGIMAEFLGLED